MGAITLKQYATSLAHVIRTPRAMQTPLPSLGPMLRDSVADASVPLFAEVVAVGGGGATLAVARTKTEVGYPIPSLTLTLPIPCPCPCP